MTAVIGDAGPAAPGALGVGNLIAEYAWLVDRWDVEGIVDLFAPGGVMDIGFGREFTGREELTSLYSGLTWSATSHHCSQPRIDCDGERASARSTMYAMHRHADGSEMELWGAYLDELVRVDGVWRFARRRLRSSMERAAQPVDGQSTRFEVMPRG